MIQMTILFGDGIEDNFCFSDVEFITLREGEKQLVFFFLSHA